MAWAGGIVGEINVRDGQHVLPGDVPIRFDETILRTNLAPIISQFVQVTGRRARLEAERDDRDMLKLPEIFAAKGHKLRK